MQRAASRNMKIAQIIPPFDSPRKRVGELGGYFQKNYPRIERSISSYVSIASALDNRLL